MIAPARDYTPAPTDFHALDHQWHRWDDWPEAVVRRLDRRRWVAVIPARHAWAIVCGPVDDPGAFDRQWTYDSRSGALLAASTWQGRGLPVGWRSMGVGDDGIIRDDE